MDGKTLQEMIDAHINVCADSTSHAHHVSRGVLNSLAFDLESAAASLVEYDYGKLICQCLEHYIAHIAMYHSDVEVGPLVTMYALTCRENHD